MSDGSKEFLSKHIEDFPVLPTNTSNQADAKIKYLRDACTRPTAVDALGHKIDISENFYPKSQYYDACGHLGEYGSKARCVMKNIREDDYYDDMTDKHVNSTMTLEDLTLSEDGYEGVSWEKIGRLNDIAAAPSNDDDDDWDIPTLRGLWNYWR